MLRDRSWRSGLIAKQRKSRSRATLGMTLRGPNGWGAAGAEGVAKTAGREKSRPD